MIRIDDVFGVIVKCWDCLFNSLQSFNFYLNSTTSMNMWEFLLGGMVLVLIINFICAFLNS